MNWQEVGDLIINLIDTDVLVRIRDKRESVKMYNRLIELGEIGSVRSVRQVFDELKGHGPAYKLLTDRRALFSIPPEQQFCEGVQQKLELLGNKAGWLWEQGGGKNPDPADPWLVSVAAHYKYVVVTNESEFSTMRIPAACKIPGIECRCISGPHFLHEVGIIKTIKPEHISAKAFFADKN